MDSKDVKGGLKIFYPATYCKSLLGKCLKIVFALWTIAIDGSQKRTLEPYLMVDPDELQNLGSALSYHSLF